VQLCANRASNDDKPVNQSRHRGLEQNFVEISNFRDAQAESHKLNGIDLPPFSHQVVIKFIVSHQHFRAKNDHLFPDEGGSPIWRPPVMRPMAKGRSFGGNQRVIRLDVEGCNRASDRPVSTRAATTNHTETGATMGRMALLSTVKTII